MFVLLFLFLINVLSAHQIHEPFIAIKKTTRSQGPTKDAFLYEKTKTGIDSSVSIVNENNYDKMITKQSKQKLVILKVYYSGNNEANKIVPIFQDIADRYKNRVFCCSIDAKKVKNKFFIEKIMKKIGIKEKVSKKDGLIFFFYLGGFLQMPIKRGFDIKDNFIKIIESMLNQKVFL